MFLRKLILTNFRNFESEEFELKDKFTVVIGSNGLGKSTILKAVQVGLGGLIQSIPSLPSGASFRRQFIEEDQFCYWNETTKSLEAYIEDTEVYLEVEVEKLTLPLLDYKNHYYEEKPNCVEIFWNRKYLNGKETTHNQRDSNYIIRYGRLLYNWYLSKEKPLPILANFNTKRNNSEIKKVEKSLQKMSRIQKGYFSALAETVNFESVTAWLYHYEVDLKNKSEFEGTKEAFLEAIRNALGGYILEVSYSSVYNDFLISLDFKDGQSTKPKLLSFCSDGVRSFIMMVSEIAYRCVMLNGYLGKDCIKESYGIVLIDEIDMLLHPNWQKHVVSDLSNAFPKIQFIATTHSPFIVQSLKSDQLLNLNKNIPEPDVEPFQSSLEDVAENEMDVEQPNRSEKFLEMEKAASEYFRLIDIDVDQHDIDRVKERLDELELLFSDNPVYVAFMKNKRIAKGYETSQEI